MAVRIPVRDSAPTVSFGDAAHFVFDALRGVSVFRDPGGRRIELQGVLALAVLAMTAGHTTYREIETWGKLREETLIPLLGLVCAPSDSGIRRIAQGVDAEAVRGVLGGSAAMPLAERTGLVTETGCRASRAARVANRRSAHVVSTVELNAGVITDAKHCCAGEGELAASRRLDPRPAAGRAEIAAGTADALHTNAPHAARAVCSGGHDVLKVEKTRDVPAPADLARSAQDRFRSMDRPDADARAVPGRRPRRHGDAPCAARKATLNQPC